MTKRCTQICITLTDPIRDRMKAEADYEGLNVSAFVRQLFLQHERRKGKKTQVPDDFEDGDTENYPLTLNANEASEPGQ